MSNERLCATLLESDYDQRSLADELGLDHKSVQRWITRDITPRRSTAHRAAKHLGVTPAWLWPDLESDRESASHAEIVTLYPHRSEVPRHLWLDLVTGADRRIWLYANASLFLPEDNPESIDIIQRKAEAGLDVRIMMADPDSPECVKRGVEERLFDAIPARVRMALAYYLPLAGVPGVEFRLQSETLYNSIFVYDDEMLINQHVYGMYGYMAPWRPSSTCAAWKEETSSTCTSEASNAYGTYHPRSRNRASGNVSTRKSCGRACRWPAWRSLGATTVTVLLGRGFAVRRWLGPGAEVLGAGVPGQELAECLAGQGLSAVEAAFVEVGGQVGDDVQPGHVGGRGDSPG